MDTIRTLGMSLCLTVVITALFSMLIPDTKLDKVLKFAISLFFLTSLVSPFLSGNLDFHIAVDASADPPSNTQLEESMAEQFSGLAAQRISAAVEGVLETAGIFAQNVRVETTISEDGSISISELTVTISPADVDWKMEIIDILRRETGITPVITEG